MSDRPAGTGPRFRLSGGRTDPRPARPDSSPPSVGVSEDGRTQEDGRVGSGSDQLPARTRVGGGPNRTVKETSTVPTLEGGRTRGSFPKWAQEEEVVPSLTLRTEHRLRHRSGGRTVIGRGSCRLLLLRAGKGPRSRRRVLVDKSYWLHYYTQQVVITLNPHVFSSSGVLDPSEGPPHPGPFRNFLLNLSEPPPSVLPDMSPTQRVLHYPDFYPWTHLRLHPSPSIDPLLLLWSMTRTRSG